MVLNNQNGNTLVENVVALLILAILSALVGTILLSCVTLFNNANAQSTQLKEVYNDIQLRDINSQNLATTEGTISFEYDGYSIDIGGTYIYDKESKRLFEFLDEDSFETFR